MVESYKLNSGGEIPGIGFGTWFLKGEAGAQSILDAIKSGYRLIDTAKFYENEREVGVAAKHSGVPREQLFITTKLWRSDLGYHSGRAAFDESLARLDMDYVDLYLIHWPSSDERHKAWRALEEIFEEGRARAIGVSNYEVWHLEELLDHSDTVPAVNQIEFHPAVYGQQKPIVDFCHAKDIVVEAYSPLTHASYLNDPKISSLAQKHKRSNAQILIRWAIQHQTIPIPKASSQKHITENLDVFDFELSDKEMTELNGLSG